MAIALRIIIVASSLNLLEPMLRERIGEAIKIGNFWEWNSVACGIALSGFILIAVWRLVKDWSKR